MEAKPICGPTRWPLVGNVFSLDKGNLQRTLFKWRKDYGPVFRFTLLSEDIVVISEPSLMKEVFSVLIDRLDTSAANILMANKQGVTLSSYQGNQSIVKPIVWKIMNDTFQDEHIRGLSDQILDELIDTLISQTDGVTDVYDAVLLGIATQTSAEITGNKPSKEVMNACMASFEAIFDFFREGRAHILTQYPWLQYVPSTLKRVVDTFTRTRRRVTDVMTEDAKKSYKRGQEHGMIQRFMSRQEEENEKAGCEKITDENMVGSCILDVITGGIVGPTENISACFLYMLLYPEVRDKLNGEILKIRKVKKANELVEKDLPYLNAFIFECMRMASTLYITVSHHVNEDVTIAGYQFKKNQNVVGGLWNAHHSEETWGDPFNLRPERFLDQLGDLVPSSHPARQAFVPFCVGTRACKGARSAMDKIFKFVSRILYRCEVVPFPGKELPSGDSRDFKSDVVLSTPKFSCIFRDRTS